MEHENGSDEMILVPRAELLAWAKAWLYENDPGDGTDCVTPFDTYLLKSPVEAHCTTCSCVPGMTPAVRFDTTPVDSVQSQQLRIAADHFHRFTAALVRAGYPNALSTAATAALIESALEHTFPDADNADEAAASLHDALYRMRWSLALLPMDNGTNTL